MTKYVLQSGGLKRNPEKTKEFFAEVFKGVKKNPNVLLCFFAELRENWEIKYENFKLGVVDFIPEHIRPKFELALPNTFEIQIKKADVLYIYGGDDHLLQYWLKQYPLKKLFNNKTIATISAGSDALSVASWSCDWRDCVDGLGILPIKFIPHFKSNEFVANDPRGPIDWEAAYKELKEYGDKDLPIYALGEGDYVVFEI